MASGQNGGAPSAVTFSVNPLSGTEIGSAWRKDQLVNEQADFAGQSEEMATRLRSKVVRHPGMVVVVVALQDAAIGGLFVDVVECLLKLVGKQSCDG